MDGNSAVSFKNEGCPRILLKRIKKLRSQNTGTMIFNLILSDEILGREVRRGDTVRGDTVRGVRRDSTVPGDRSVHLKWTLRKGHTEKATEPAHSIEGSLRYTLVLPSLRK